MCPLCSNFGENSVLFTAGCRFVLSVVVKDRLCNGLEENSVVSSSANLSGEKIPLNFSEISSRIKNNVDYIVKQDKNINSHSSSRILKLQDDGSFLTLR